MKPSQEIRFITDVNTLRFSHVYDIQPPIALLTYLMLHILSFVMLIASSQTSRLSSSTWKNLALEKGATNIITYEQSHLSILSSLYAVLHLFL